MIACPCGPAWAAGSFTVTEIKVFPLNAYVEMLSSCATLAPVPSPRPGIGVRGPASWFLTALSKADWEASLNFDSKMTTKRPVGPPLY